MNLTFLNHSQLALFSSLLLAGILLASTGHIASYLVIFILLGALFLIKPMLYCLLCAFIPLLGAVFYLTTYPQMIKQDLPLLAKAYFSPDSIKFKTTSFGPQWVYKGHIKQLHVDGAESILLRIPVTISYPLKTGQKRYLADRDYEIVGTLKQTNRGSHFFVPLKNTPWNSLDDTHHIFRLAETRHSLKEVFNRKIDENYQSVRSKNFLKGVLTGEFNDRLLSYELGRYGLQHIMAISGFHFAVIAGFLGLTLKSIPSKKLSAFILMFFLLLYFLFIGPSASVMRAWVSCTLLLTSFAFCQRSNSINNLSVALTACLLFDPSQALSIGFQFSFAATAAILILYSPIDKLLSAAFSTRNLSDVIKMNFFEQAGCCLIPYVRKSLSLMLAVNLAVIPLSLYWFGKFPLLSLIFNLVFPVLVSFCLILLLSGLFLSLIFSSLGGFIHSFNDQLTDMTLTLVSDFPKNLDTTLYISAIGPLTVTIWLLILFACGLYFRQHEQDESAWRWI